MGSWPPLALARRARRRRAALGLVAAGLLLVAGGACKTASSPPARDKPSTGANAVATQPRWVYLYAGSVEIRAEVAATPETRQLGLMHRTALEPSSGMVFVFPERRALDFWMLNVPMALSIAFLEDDGTIVRIEEMAPGDGIPAEDQRRYHSGAPVRLALEMAAGWFADHGIRAGDKLDLGTLLRDVKPS